jgi:hypothetical protein
MDFSKFSLDYLRPSAPRSDAPVQPDSWAAAVKFYGTPVRETLQEEGRKSIADLFDSTKQKLGISDLQIDQFVELIRQMVDHGELSVSQKGDRPHEMVVALPLEKPRG